MRRDSIRRLKQARATKGPGCSYWPTPTASMNGNWPEVIADGGRLDFRNPPGGYKTRSLRQVARAWMVTRRLLAALGIDPRPTRSPCSRPIRVTLRPGTMCSAETLDLNPRFGEWVMGWPIGWTACAPLETAFAPWLRRSRTELSRRLSTEATDVETMDPADGK
ncbi:hypothetical protein GGD89_003989 [Roseospira visakhapatnamensis]|uniref:Uncharacterized protein n=1 Tax=Roseospira visakhapatnamensis TaxID=390880 RepID=A0A7W6WC78_9PROT|nr:hypothetical protein [Roseospira visakhapatnamensis]